MTIIAPLPYNIANGDPVDATPPMANFNQIRNNVNANAADVNAQNTFSQPQNGVPGVLPAQFVTLAQVQAMLLGAQPIGAILSMAIGGVPAGYLWCNGAAVSRTTYALLFAVIGTTWGAGDGVSTFNVPNLIDRSPVGAGSSFAAGTLAGAYTHAVSVAEMPSHNHGINDPTHAHSLYDPGHNHGVNDPSHAHSVSDPGHTHTYSSAVAGGVAAGGPWTSGNVTSNTTSNNGSNIGIFGNYTGISLNAAATGMGVYAAATGITTQANGSNAAFSLFHPVAAVIMLIRTGL